MTTDVTTPNADASTSNMTSESIKTNGVDTKPATQPESSASSTNETANPTPASTSTEAETDKTEKSEKADKKEEAKPEPPKPVGSVDEIKAIVEFQKGVGTEVLELDAYLSSRTKKTYKEYALVTRQVYDSDDKLEKTVIDINSSQLHKALKEVVKFYPAHPLNFDKQASFESPFMLLNHYRDDLKEYAEKEGDETTSKHMDLLLQFLESEAGEKGVEAKHQLEAGMVTFKMLWSVFRPGDLLYSTEYGHPRLYRFEKGDYQDSLCSKGWSYNLCCTYTTCDGTDAGQATVTLPIWEKQEFVGGDSATAVTGLSLYPLKFLDEKEQGELKETLKVRGERYLTIRGITSFEYAGLFMYLKTPPYDFYDESSNYDGTWLPKTTNERVLVDAKTFVEEMREKKEEFSGSRGSEYFFFHIQTFS